MRRNHPRGNSGSWRWRSGALDGRASVRAGESASAPLPDRAFTPWEVSSHASISCRRAKTLSGFEAPKRRTGRPKSFSHRWTVRTLRPRYAAISFQPFSWLDRPVAPGASVEDDMQW